MNDQLEHKETGETRELRREKKNANEGKDHVVQSGGAIHTVRRPDPTPDTNCDGRENMTAFVANIV